MLPLLLVTAWYGHQVYAAVKPVYYSQAVVGLAPPSFRVDTAAAGQPVPRNGLLDIGGAPLLANMSALALREPTIVNRVVAGGGRSDYTARLFPVPPTAPPIPLVMIENTAPDPESASKTLELVTDEMSPALERIQKQANVPPEMMVDSFVVTPPTEPVAAMPTRTRSTASIIVAGTGLTVLISVLADVVLMRRRRRKADLQQSAKDPVLTQPTATAEGDDPGPNDPLVRHAGSSEAAADAQ
jgi:hypothetical protein